MNNIADELGLFEKKPKFPFSKKQVLFAFIILWLGFYIGNIFYGENNLLTLLALQEERTLLEIKVKELNEKNAELQKTFFEMMVIEGNI